MSRNSELQARKVAAVARGQGNMFSNFVDHALNAELWDVDGKRYIDFGAGIAVVNTGHSHPKVVAAVKQQVENFSHTCIMVNPYESGVTLAEKLNALAPGDTPKKTIFVSTGAEAVENAVKIARAHTGRRGIIAFNGGFHGRTNMTMGLTGKITPYKNLFGPFPGEIYHVPFPSDFHEVSVADSMIAIEKLFKVDIAPTDVAAILIEPIQGEGGFIVPPKGFLPALAKYSKENGIVFIADEVQTGFARTGHMFAVEEEGVVPDMVVTAKGIAGGLPLAAVTGRAEVMDSVHASGLGGTYGGNPIACAAALGAMETMEEENLVARARHIGEILGSALRDLAKKYPVIGEVRGRGAMQAIELVEPGTKNPNTAAMNAVVKYCQSQGVLVLTAGTYSNVVRFLPPIVITDELLKDALSVLEEAFASL